MPKDVHFDFLVGGKPIIDFAPGSFLDPLKIFLEVDRVQIFWVLIFCAKDNILRGAGRRASPVDEVFAQRRVYTDTIIQGLGGIVVCIGIVE